MAKSRGGGARVGVRWIRPPEELARAIERYGDRVLQAVAAVAQYTATAMQNDAKANAPWTDRTGNARTGLFGTSEADFAGHVVTIYLSHGATIDYGVFLELGGGSDGSPGSGRYAIIMRTMQNHYEPLMQMLREAFA
jgi:hypothetical protein